MATELAAVGGPLKVPSWYKSRQRVGGCRPGTPDYVMAVAASAALGLLGDFHRIYCRLNDLLNVFGAPGLEWTRSQATTRNDSARSSQPEALRPAPSPPSPPERPGPCRRAGTLSAQLELIQGSCEVDCLP